MLPALGKQRPRKRQILAGPRPRVPDAVRHSSCRSAEPGPYQAPAPVTAPALQRTTPQSGGALRCVRGTDSPRRVRECAENPRPRADAFVKTPQVVFFVRRVNVVVVEAEA